MAASALSLVPKRLSLFEHIRDVEGIADLVEALDDANELTPEISDQLSEELIKAIAGTKEKIDRTTSVLAQFEAAEAAAKLERDRLDNRAKYFARQAARLSDYIIAVLTASNLPRIEGNTSAVRLKKNPPSVVIDEIAAVPVEYMRRPPAPPPEPDKALIKSVLLGGAEVPGCRIDRRVRLERS